MEGSVGTIVALLAALVLVLPPTVHSSNCGGCCENGQKGGRVWILAGGDDFGTLDRTDNNNAINGWGKAVALAACKAAGLTCKFIYAPYSDCWDNGPPPDGWKQHLTLGNGLANDHFDACVGWYPTRERRDNAIFSTGFINEQPASLWYIGAAPNWSNRENFRIAFAVGPPEDDTCVCRLYQRLGYNCDNVVFVPSYAGTGGAIELVANSAADVVLTYPRDATLSLSPHLNNLEVYDINNNGNNNNDNSDLIICDEGPGGLFAKPDKWELVEAFNVGLQRIFENGEYEGICTDPYFDDRPTPTTEHYPWCIDV